MRPFVLEALKTRAFMARTGSARGARLGAVLASGSLACLLALVTSCGSRIEPPGGPPALDAGAPPALDAGDPPPSIEETAAAIASKFCRASTHSGERFVRDCTARLTTHVRRWAAPSLGWVSAASLARCVDERDPTSALRCARIRPGRAPGERCGGPLECASGRCSSDGVSCGVCVELGQEGARCKVGYGGCAEHLRCAPTGAPLSEGRCRRVDELRCTESAECPAGFACDGGRCLQVRGFGLPCGPGAPCWVSDGVRCVRGPDGARCERPTLPGLGAPCDGLCDYPHVCDTATKTCVRGALSAEPCDDAPCGELMTICTPTRGGRPTCQPVPHARTNCD